MFEEWFVTVKDQVTGDLAIRLQQEFEELNRNVEQYKFATEQMIAEYQNDTSNAISTYKSDMNQIVNEYKQNTDQAVNTAQGLVTDYVDKDFVIEKQRLTFNNNICKITNSKVTANTLVDVYFTSETMDAASKANIYVDSYDGYIQLTAEMTPTGPIEAIIRVRVR